MSKKKERGDTGRKWIVILIIALALVVVLGVGLYLYLEKRNEPKTGYRDADALQGRVQAMTDEEIQAELNQIVEEGMFNISIASIVVVYGPEQTAILNIENKQTNRYLMRVTVTLDELNELGEQETAYQSGVIEPGYYIPEAKLDLRLEPGEYEATAVFTALYPDTESEVGTAGAKIKLYVLDAAATPPAETPSPSPSLDASPSPSPTPAAN